MDESLITCSRRIEWDCMHRVPGHDGACRAFHGHRYVAEFTCCGEIDDAGMIVDFGVVKQVMGAWINENFDHTAILHREDRDPAVEHIVASNRAYGKPVYLMDRPPTAEHIAAELARVASEKLGEHGISVVEVTVAETPNCKATWSRIRTTAARK